MNQMNAEQLRAVLLKLAAVASLMDPADNADAKRADHLDSELRRLAARLSGVTSAPAWQPIETAPKDGSRVIVLRPSANQFRRIGIDRWHNGLWWESRPAEFPTHWMPLPAATEPPNA